MDKTTLQIPPNDCSGCSACANICPKGAITMSPDKEGFLYPNTNNDLCVHCNLCINICPILNNCQRNVPGTEDAFAAFIRDENLRKQSSSGGVFSALAKEVLKNKGIVFGAALCENNASKCVFIGIEDSNDLPLLQGSKYVQAEIGLSYKKAKSYLQEGRTVLFSGTPCQIAGLYSYLGKKEFDNLFTVDIVCHGVPSPLVYEKYLHFVKAQNDSKNIQAISFRNKTSGWQNYSTSIKFSDGSEKSTLAKNNLYIRAFLSNICTRKSCFSCKYSRIPRIADISLGDFWGVKYIHQELNDDKGVSLVSVNNEHGKALWNSSIASLDTKQTLLKKAIIFNPRFYSPSKPNPKRNKFFSHLENMPFNILVEKYCPRMGLIQKIIKKINRFILLRRNA